jgi:hypothetical protein
MATSKQVKAIDLYAALMREARQRIDAVIFILDGGTRLPEAIIRELCYLQFRMLCETIAIGCLVAHGDIVEARIKNFEKEWAADKIMRVLETLKPDFYPQQVTLLPNVINANTNPNALTKKELFKLYAQCGEFLHRGRVKKVMQLNPNPFAQPKIDSKDILFWNQKIDDLLGCHIMTLGLTETKASILLCVLRDQANGFDTTVKRIEYRPSTNPSG